MLCFNMVSESHPVPYRFSTFGANPVLAHISHIFVNLVVNINISIAWKRKAYFKLGSIILSLRLSLLLLFICCFCFCSCCCSVCCCYYLKLIRNWVSHSWDIFVVVVVVVVFVLLLSLLLSSLLMMMMMIMILLFYPRHLPLNFGENWVSCR